MLFTCLILGQDGPQPVHKCDWKCQNENVCGNVYRCRLTGLTHICDKNCNQRILYDDHSSLCQVSKQVFPPTLVEQQAMKGVRRKLDSEGGPAETCGFKRKRDIQFHSSPFERSFNAVGPYAVQLVMAWIWTRVLHDIIISASVLVLFPFICWKLNWTIFFVLWFYQRHETRNS